MSPHISDTIADKPLYTDDQKDYALCLFSYGLNGIPMENVSMIVDPAEASVFSGSDGSLDSILPKSTRAFLRSALKNGSAHYVLLLSSRNTPLLVVTSAFSRSGLCLAIVLGEQIDTVLSYLRAIPQITVLKDPLLSGRLPSSDFDPAALERLQRCFRRVFTFFESPFAFPTCYTDPIALFRLMKQKLSSLSELFGITPGFLLPYSFDEPIRRNLTVDTDLFAASSLLLSSAIKRYSDGKPFHVVFITVDGCPSVCFHFCTPIGLVQEEEITRLLSPLIRWQSGYLRVLCGEEARKESEKIPGVGYMLKNEGHAFLREHVLCIFSPVTRDWSTYVNRSPIFRLPDRFYEGF